MLNQQQRDILGAKILESAIYYGKDFSNQQVSMFINALEKYMPDTVENYISAIDRYCMDGANKFFPSPMQLRVYIENKLSRDSEASATAAAIRRAVSDHGWSAPEKARAQIGELGWQIVNDMGGWLYICENLGVDLNPSTFFAQTRDVAKSYLERNEKIAINENQIGFQDKNVLNMPIKTLTKEK